MSTPAVVADVLLGMAVAVVLASAIGVLAMRDTYQKLHFLTPIGLVAPVLVAVAITVRMGWQEDSGQTWLAVLFLVLAGPLVGHATIRAARIRREGDWRGREQASEDGRNQRS